MVEYTTQASHPMVVRTVSTQAIVAEARIS